MAIFSYILSLGQTASAAETAHEPSTAAFCLDLKYKIIVYLQLELKI